MDKPALPGEPLILSPEDNELKQGKLSVDKLYERLKRFETDESNKYSDRLTAGCAANTLRTLLESLLSKNRIIQNMMQENRNLKQNAKRR